MTHKSAQDLTSFPEPSSSCIFSCPHIGYSQLLVFLEHVTLTYLCTMPSSLHLRPSLSGMESKVVGQTQAHSAPRPAYAASPA